MRALPCLYLEGRDDKRASPLRHLQEIKVKPSTSHPSSQLPVASLRDKLLHGTCPPAPWRARSRRRPGAQGWPRSAWLR
eukprot:757023-Hanusia_phi.AAC.4